MFRMHLRTNLINKLTHLIPRKRHPCVLGGHSLPEVPGTCFAPYTADQRLHSSEDCPDCPCSRKSKCRGSSTAAPGHTQLEQKTRGACGSQDMLPNGRSRVRCTVRPNNTRMTEFGAENSLLQGHARKQGAHAPKAPNSSKGFSKAFLKAK